MFNRWHKFEEKYNGVAEYRRKYCSFHNRMRSYWLQNGLDFIHKYAAISQWNVVSNAAIGYGNIHVALHWRQAFVVANDMRSTESFDAFLLFIDGEELFYRIWLLWLCRVQFLPRLSVWLNGLTWSIVHAYYALDRNFSHLWTKWRLLSVAYWPIFNFIIDNKPKLNLCLLCYQSKVKCTKKV